MLHFATVVLIFALTSFSYAQNNAEEEPGFKGESELGNTATTGNSMTNSLAAKTENKYNRERDFWALSGRYLRNTDQNIETALSWETALRYSRKYSENLSAFLGYKVEADPYAGYVQRDSTDLGLKYSFIRSEELFWFGEAGYRYTKTHVLAGNTYESFGRLYTEIKYNLTKTTYAKLWAEYLPNFSAKERYLANAEATLSVSISEILSLKIGYLLKYQNQPPPGFERTDSIFVTTLVAKY